MPVQERWTAGAIAWSAAFGTEINSLGTSNNCVISSQVIDNTTAGDMFMDLSIQLGSVTTGAGNVFLGFYLYPLLADLATYGDGRFGSAAAGPPLYDYWVGNVSNIASTAGAINQCLRGIQLPFNKCKLVIWNQLGVALASSGNNIKYQTYNRKISS